MFFVKLFIFQRTFSSKLSHFLVFGNDLENEFENVFWCLVCNFFFPYIIQNIQVSLSLAEVGSPNLY